MLALGFALAAPVAAYAYDGASKPLHHHHRPALHRAVHLSALVPAPAEAAIAALGLWSPTDAQSPEQQETDGLSRNPDDCVTYGCVDNN